ncbi:uncharacterized protein LOC129756968 [Uranotaenia lowii]|uniref:uncharacterized protein LOC129756968 n=1 Tax=Uranotaenia lowii TaxID=190385 RepID=UPI00247A3A8B|nr:uncharacterized protein LOC129756968 [Uranotaenia lowii]
MSVTTGAPPGAPMDGILEGCEKTLDPAKKDGGKRVFEKYLYANSDTGPYKVIIEKEEEKDKPIGINKISVGIVLKQNGFTKSIMDIRKIGRSKVLVYFQDFAAANRLVSCKNLSLRKYAAYIPKGFVSVKGVISGIPEDIDVKELQSEIDSNKEILEIFRMHRFVSKDNKVPLKKVCVVFRSNKLPDSVRIYAVNMRVEAYVNRAVMCNACLRYGHKADNCKGRKRCDNCGNAEDENHDIKNCVNLTKCVHCKESHKASDPKCPERAKQAAIKKLMACQNLTFQEAKEEFRVETRNGFDILSNMREFPSIYESFATVTAKSVKPPTKPQNQPRKPVASTSASGGNSGQTRVNIQHIQKTKQSVNNADDDSCSSVQPKKRKTHTSSDPNDDTENQQMMPVQQYLELRKRWDDQMQILANQRESYKSAMKKSYTEPN